MEKPVKKVLVVDDDPDIGTMLKIMLEFKGYSSQVAERADKAEAIIRENPAAIQLIIMDMLLSGVDGTDICASLKKNPDTAAIPVIMISAHPSAKEICMTAGADDFISKPFDMKDVFSKINYLTTRQGNKI